MLFVVVIALYFPTLGWGQFNNTLQVTVLCSVTCCMLRSENKFFVIIAYLVDKISCATQLPYLSWREIQVSLYWME